MTAKKLDLPPLGKLWLQVNEVASVLGMSEDTFNKKVRYSIGFQQFKVETSAGKFIRKRLEEYAESHWAYEEFV